jgi:hypothetical protein
MQFKIYYENGTTFSSESPTELNPFGVIAIAQINPKKGREILDGTDYYYLRNKIWYGCDLHGLLDQIIHNLDELTVVLVGRMTDRENFERIVGKAIDDPGLPRMSAK